MSDLCGGKFRGLSFAASQADAPGSKSFKRSVIVEVASGGIPEQSVHVEKIVLQQLLDSMRFSSSCHVGVIFDAPQIKNNSPWTKPAFYPAERIRPLIGLA